MPDEAAEWGPPFNDDFWLRLRHPTGREVNIGETDLRALAGLESRLAALEAATKRLFQAQTETWEQLAQIRALLEPLE